MRAPRVRQPLGYDHLDTLRYLLAAARHPPLRGQRMRLGQGAHLMIAPEAQMQISPGFRARRDLTLTVQGSLRIGVDMFCNRGVVIAAMREVIIGDRVRVGERSSIIDSNHTIEPLGDVESRFREYQASPVRIGDRVLISANCVVVAGVVIGDDAVIAAGSVVIGEIPPGVLAAGAPAVVKRTLRR